MLIKLDKILECEITLLNMKIDLINKLDLINMLNLITVIIINNKKSSIYQLIDQILHINYIYNFMQNFRDLAQLLEFKK